ncbi:protein FAR1-RELATED SEQUENCE 5-like [Cynara cardunculus var. scolymus]|uniref:protein FAR1-RELATED SEQUENCE 5-like n=1 Tax=Cynara cardunculus var. scolymus TaxID=59895 RepID=UPI000D625653|nr:protein FAR1-RELATED SEQUENCE 5-like [Cynara cardunculus var. scolymus]
MYRRYADIVGFDIRLSTQKTRKGGIVKLKYVVRHKHGKPKKRLVDSVEVDGHRRQVQNTNFKVTDCKASVRFKYIEGSQSSYRLYYFCPNHNHDLIDDADRILSRKSRQLSYDDKVMVHWSARSNIGPARSHKLQVCLKGGYDEVGSSVVDYKNFKRGLNNYIGDGDVQMVVNMLNDRRQYGTNFAFEYKIDNGRLVSMFWANELTRSNYAEFSDVMSFDATYRFNKRSVVFGSGLITEETIQAYTWLLESFLKVHGRQPTLVLTDQDASIKEAIPVVFSDARHRLCMWHIMKKLPAKVLNVLAHVIESSDIILNTNFKKRLLKLVWSVHLEPDEFEVKRASLLNEFDLNTHPWLEDVFEMRTKFILSHDTAIDKQRNRQRNEDHKTNTTTPTFKTNTLIEYHAAKVYTRAIFFKVQKEIFKGYRCSSQWQVNSEMGFTVYTIRERKKHCSTKLEFKVAQSHSDDSIYCDCRHFEYYGTLCRHVFTALDEGVIPVDVLRSRHISIGSDSRVDKLSNDVYLEVGQCLMNFKGDEDKITAFLDNIRSWKSNMLSGVYEKLDFTNKDDVIQSLVGVP